MILILALFFVAVGGLLAFSLSQRGSGVTVEVRTGQESARARQAALAAIEELAFELANRANADGNPVAAAFRDTSLRSGGRPVPLPVGAGPDWLPSYHAHVAPAMDGVKLTGVSAQVIGARPYRTASLPFHGEHYGAVWLVAKVAVVRRGLTATEIVAERWFEYKCLRPTLPPPFDRMRLVMENAAGWADARAQYDARQPELESANNLVTAILADFDHARARIKELRDNAKEPLMPDVVKNEIRDGTAEAEAQLDAAKEIERFWRSGPPEVELRYFFEPSLRYILEGEVLGNDVNLPAFFAANAPRRLSEWVQVKGTEDAIDKALKDGEFGNVMPLGKRSRAETRALLGTDILLLTEMKSIHERFVRRVGRIEVPKVFGPHLAVLKEGASPVYQKVGNAVTVSAGRATHAVGAPDAKRELVSLVRSTGRFSGVVDVENENQELVLNAADGPLPAAGGRLTVVVHGDAFVDGVNPGGGTLTVICHGKLRAKGDVNAALISLGSFEPAGATTVRGTLFVSDHAADGSWTGVRAPEAVLADVKVVPDPRQWSWAPPAEVVKPESYHVFFGPRLLHENTFRQRPGAK